jgi:hypothetical protein
MARSRALKAIPTARHFVFTKKGGEPQLLLLGLSCGFNFYYKVIVTTKTASNKGVVQCPNRRGSQEANYSDGKGDCGLNVIAT